MINSIRLPRTLIIQVATAMMAAVVGLGVVVITRRLEGAQLVAAVAGLAVLGVASASGRLEHFLFALMILVVPFNVDLLGKSATATADNTASMQPVGLAPGFVILCLLYVLWMWHLIGDPSKLTKILPPATIPLLALIGWGALSVINAREPLETMRGVLAYIKGMLCFLYMANYAKRRDQLRMIGICLVIGLLIEGVIACIQAVVGHPLGLDMLGERGDMSEIDSFIMLKLGADKVSRVVGTQGHPNHLGRYLATVLPLVLLYNLPAAKFKWPMRLVILAASLLGMAALVLTLSRAAWLSFGVAGFALVGWLCLQRRAKVGPLIAVLAALAVVAVAFSPLIFARWTESDYGAAESRLTLLQIASTIISTHPILGVGLYNYKSVMYLYDTTSVGITFSQHQYRVHNAYFLMAAEIGLVGLACLGWFLLTVARQAWRRIAATSDDFTRFTIMGIALGLMAFLVDALAEPIFLIRDPLFLIYAGILAAVVWPDRQRGEART